VKTTKIKNFSDFLNEEEKSNYKLSGDAEETLFESDKGCIIISSGHPKPTPFLIETIGKDYNKNTNENVKILNYLTKEQF
jgi:hypothetical protein